ncbi:hypothetical protein [Alkalimarinus coralli]|uniref:hypothetical protein n=1 Tax=Alkalimarinus coralli TaxID=2935863 RepID=UPI00202ACF07|nr:hypothetical protein [Alkalimarinus coralli]
MLRRASQQGLLLSVLLMLLNLSGCFEDRSESSSSQAQDGSSEEQPFVIKPEIYGDPDIFDGPRIQFAMKAPGENRRTIWSIKTDGTDLRQAVNNQRLRGETDAVFNHPPVRSPDNRYIAISMMTSEGLEKQLIDLKSNTKITFAKGGGIPLFQWTSDSKEVFFHMDQNLWRYHVDRKTMTKEVKIGYQGTYYLRDKDQFFVVQEDGFEWFDRQGESIRKVVLNTKWGLRKWHQLSLSGRRFLYTQSRDEYWYIVDTEAPYKIIYKRNDGVYDASTFSKTGEFLFVRSWGGIARLNIDTGETIKIYDSVRGLGGTAFYTLINTDS